MFVLRWLNEKLEEIPLMALFCAMVVVMGVQVFFRYCLNNSLSWSEEMTRYMFIWCGFLSIGYCIGQNSSIRIEMLVDLFPPLLRRSVKFFEHILLLFFFGYMCLGSWEFLLSSISSGQVSPAAGVPMYLVQSAPLVGSVLALVRTLQELARNICGPARSGRVS